MNTHTKNNYITDFLLKAGLVLSLAVLGFACFTLYNTCKNLPALELSVEEETAELMEELNRYETSQALYSISVELMDKGYSDARSEFLVEDEEYINWRNESMPVYGGSSSVTLPISVNALDDGVTEDDINYVNNCLSNIPSNFLKKAADDGWVVNIVSNGDFKNTLVDGYNALQVRGETDRENKTVTVGTDYLECIYHEFGHVLAEEYCYEQLVEAGYYDIDEKTELSTLYNHNAYGSVYIYLNPAEQLAESFYDYIWYPREMQAQAPSLYKIFEDTIEKM